MNEEMTIEEIAWQFESEWVLIENPRTDEKLKVLRGKVLYHSQDWDAVYRRAVSLRPKRSAILYTGEIPAETSVVVWATGSIPNAASLSFKPRCLALRGEQERDAAEQS